jgi:hypothetical protein
MTYRLQFAAFLFLFVVSLNANALDKGIIGVNFDDIARHKSSSLPEASALKSYIEGQQIRLFTGFDKILFLGLENLPQVQGTATRYDVLAFVQYPGRRLVFERLSILADAPRSFRVLSQASVNLSQTNFRVEVGLVEKIAVLSDKENDLTMIFPLGVGSFDEGILNEEYSLLTPRFKNAYLSKRAVIESRTTPRYFAGKPFIRLLDGEQKAHTPIGFHAQPNLDNFIRAFDSHGCIRMQLNDLDLLYLLVAQNPRNYIPITVAYHLDYEVSHPFPKRVSSYQGIYNVGTRSNPMYTLDRDHLVQTTYRKGQPPVHLLFDQEDDNNEEFFNYSSEPCRIKSFGKEPRRGWAESLTSTLKWQRCQPRTQRNTLYRLWVHR